MISKLHLYRRPHGISADLTTYREYLKTHLINKTQPSYEQVQLIGSGNASVVDCDRYKTIIYFTPLMCVQYISEECMKFFSLSKG